MNAKHMITIFGFLLIGIAGGAQVTMSPSFTEGFGDSVLRNFRYGSTGVKDDFKWKAGVASTVERGSKVLRFRIDPADSAGPGRGPEIISNEYTHYGSYSARIKI